MLSWGFGIAIGLGCLVEYESTPGRAANCPLDWPANHEFQLSPGRINIIMLAHPRCPCTRASLDQLQGLIVDLKDRVTADVFFWMPSVANNDWKETDLWRKAMSIPGLHVHADEGGAEAKRLGAATSGQVVIYRDDGTWLFSGGVTDARGRFGDSQGAAAIRKLVSDGTNPRSEITPVFGCPLFRSDSTCIEGTQSCPK